MNKQVRLERRKDRALPVSNSRDELPPSVNGPTIRSIRLKDQTELAMQAGSVIALVGPNNSGKSHFLAQLRAVLFDGPTSTAKPSVGLIDSVRLSWPSADLVSYLELVADRKIPKQKNVWNADLPYDVYESPGTFSIYDIRSLAEQRHVLGPFIETFVRYDEPLSRIEESQKQSLANLSNALVRLQRQEEAYESVQNDFSFIFDEEIRFWPFGGELNLFLGEPDVELPGMTEAYSSEVIRFLESAPTLDRQGLGMRNVIGLLVRLYTDSRNIVLIDEPEAFLHPPQADRLGQIVGKVCEREQRQIICATHDRNFISGLSKGSSGLVAIQRLGSEGGAERRFFSKSVEVESLQEVRNRSRIRFTPILESMFTSVTVLVENEKDALFFEEALSYLASTSPSTVAKHLRDSILFIPTNGNSNFGSTRRLLGGLHSPAVIVGDLDLVSDPKRLGDTVASTGSDNSLEVKRLAEEIISRFKVICADELLGVKKENQEGKLKRLVAKQIRLHHSDPEIQRLVSDLLQILERCGVLLIPQGELEDFDRSVTRSNDKNEWVREAIGNGVHKLKTVQDFSRRILTCAEAAVQIEHQS